ncbi:MAG: hypothetical protein JOY52_02275 [Hyphomicrobiales bacterium]|nr:hypothetical protein [Hyphomicrobiales bacterium]
MALEDVVARPGIRTRDSDDIADGVDNRVKNQCIEYRKAAEPVRGWLNAQPLGIEPRHRVRLCDDKDIPGGIRLRLLALPAGPRTARGRKLLRDGRGKDDLDNALGLSTEHVMLADGEWTNARAEAAVRLELLNQSRFVGHCSGL